MFTAALGGRLLQICANTDFVLIASSRYVMSWSISPVTVQCDLPSAASATDPGLENPVESLFLLLKEPLGNRSCTSAELTSQILR